MILITGATGIVGSHIAVQLLQASNDVRLLVRPSSNKTAIIQLLRYHSLEDTFNYVAGDINDPLSLENAMDGVDIVYHCAAAVHFGSGRRDELFLVNVMGTRRVADMCLRRQVKLCYISSTAAIGSETFDGVIKEESKWEEDADRSDYSLSKREAEMEVFRAVEEGLDAVIVNPCVIIGPGNWGMSSTSVILAATKGLLFYPSGSNAFVDARDVADIAVSLANSPHDVIGRHLLIGENMSFKRFFDIACELANSRKPSVAAPTGLILTLATIIKLFERIGFWPFKLSSSSLESACRKTVFSNDKIKGLGMEFRPLEDSVQYALSVYQMKENRA